MNEISNSLVNLFKFLCVWYEHLMHSVV